MPGPSPFHREDGFDPEGEGYDYKSAIESGGKAQVQADGKPHWGSLDPRTGMVLKGRKHPTWGLMEAEENRRGSAVVKQPSGRYHSVPLKRSSKRK